AATRPPPHATASPFGLDTCTWLPWTMLFETDPKRIEAPARPNPSDAAELTFTVFPVRRVFSTLPWISPAAEAAPAFSLEPGSVIARAPVLGVGVFVLLESTSEAKWKRPPDRVSA